MVMAEVRNVSVAEALELIDDGALILDVREDNEWESGRAANATHIALNAVPDHVTEFPKDRVILCVCRSGARSGRATKFLVDEGFDAVNLEGGMLAWSAEGEPIEGDVDEPSII
jgi:rhodanese-related sulfurtransferase